MGTNSRNQSKIIGLNKKRGRSECLRIRTDPRRRGFRERPESLIQVTPGVTCSSEQSGPSIWLFTGSTRTDCMCNQCRGYGIYGCYPVPNLLREQVTGVCRVLPADTMLTPLYAGAARVRVRQSLYLTSPNRAPSPIGLR